MSGRRDFLCVTAVPDDWPYADEATVCAACGSDDDRSVTVDSLGLVWGAATVGGLGVAEVDEYAGRLEFRCCGDCWTDEGIDALDDAATLLVDETASRYAESFEVDDRKVAAARKLSADRVAVATLRELDVRSESEREHVRAQDRAIANALDAWFDRE